MAERPPQPARTQHDDVQPEPQGDGDPGTGATPEPPPDEDAVRSNMDLPGMDGPDPDE